MFDLIRFFEKQEYVDDFLNGKLYMNSIGHFWQTGNAVQNDFAEGLGESLSIDDFEEKYNSNIPSLFGKDHILFPFMNRIEATKYCHIYCLSLHEYDRKLGIAAKVPVEMKKMGKYAVIVHNVQKFVDLIYAKLVKNRLYGLMGPVNYHSPFETNEYKDLFDKIDKNSHEKEWRFVLIPDYERAKKLAAENINRTYDEHYYYEIGNIRDIATQVDYNTLFEDIGKLYEVDGKKFDSVDSMPVPWKNRRIEVKKMVANRIPVSYDMYPEQYVGWAPRESFRNIIMNIDNGAFKPLFTIG